MAVTVDRFLQDFPEFKKTDRVLISKKLAAAGLRTQAAIWEDLTDQGIMYLAAHLLSVAPEGQQSRLKKENRVTTYLLERNRMVREVTFGAGRVI